jgi:hypothetical protein
MAMMSRTADEGALADRMGMPAERWRSPQRMSDPRVPDPAPDPIRPPEPPEIPPQPEPIDVPSPVPDNAPPPNEPTGVPPTPPPEIPVIPTTTAEGLQHQQDLIRSGGPSQRRLGPPQHSSG